MIIQENIEALRAKFGGMDPVHQARIAEAEAEILDRVKVHGTAGAIAVLMIAANLCSHVKLPKLSDEESRALEVLKQSKRPNVTAIQRAMTLGYGRASRLMETLIESGYVSRSERQGGPSYEVLS